MRSITGVFFLLMVFGFHSLCAQTAGRYSSSNKAAIRSFEDGRKYYDSRQDDKAIRSFEAALQRDSGFVEAWLILGQIYLEARNEDNARSHYRKAVSVNPEWLPAAHLIIGDLEIRVGNYEAARQDFQNYILYSKSLTEQRRREVGVKIQGCDFAINAIQHPVPFDPENMGPGINTSEAEYFPSFTVDQKEIIFTRDIKDERSAERHQEDFFISLLKDSVWTRAFNAGPPLNSGLNEGGPSISADGRVLFFTACDRPDGYGSCDIYLSQRTSDGKWSKPVNIGAPVNSSAWESQPSFSSDGKTLYFIRGNYDRSRNRIMDIYYSVFREDMTWSNPEKCSDTINTSGQEESVFIHPDNHTLYFSSDGHPGMGGSDIYVSKRLENGSWGIPQNLGYPINTYADENSLVVSADGKRAYFASDRKGGQGNLDIYRFDLYEAVQPALVSYVRARVSDAVSGNPLSAQFEIIDIESGKVLVSNSTDKRKGEFLACLPAGKNYLLNVNKESYMFYSDHFECKNATDRQHAYELNIKLHQPAPGEKVVLKNVFFDLNRYELKSESYIELNKLAEFMKAQPGLKIEVSGHTDNTGDKKSNLLLSENRARSVIEYLVKRGVEISRLSARGYGDTRPIESNDTEEGRAANRRTEFSVL